MVKRYLVSCAVSALAALDYVPRRVSRSGRFALVSFAGQVEAARFAQTVAGRLIIETTTPGRAKH